MEQNFIDSIYIGTIFEHGYGQISRKVMRDKTLSRDAKVIYSYLMSFAGNKMEAFPSWKTICEELGFKSKDTYYKYMNELKEHGLLKVVQQKEDGKWAKNIYTLALKNEQIEEFKSIPKNQETGKMGIGKNGNRKNSESNINIPLNINSSLNKEEQETILTEYKNTINKLPSENEIEAIFKFCEEYKYIIVLKAIEVMSERAKNPSISYLKATLKDWNKERLDTIEKVEESIARHELDNEKANENKKKKIKAMAEGNTIYGKQIDNFNNFEQRTYDFNKLEKQLLGWENDNNIDG